MSHDLEFFHLDSPSHAEPTSSRIFETSFDEAEVKRLLEIPEAVVKDFRPLGIPEGNNLRTVLGTRHAHINGIRNLEEGPTLANIHLEEAEPSRARRILSHVIKNERQRRYKAHIVTHVGWSAEDYPN